MVQNLIFTKPLQSSFLSCEKDMETIVRKLFVESQPYSETLKKLLVINTKDCLTNVTEPKYINKMKDMSIQKLRQEGYLKFSPKIRIPEHEEIRTYLIITFDDFVQDKKNPFYRDCTVTFDIICHTDYWEMDNYQLRPLKIAGIIDGILNNAKLSGIGTFNFLTCGQTILDEVLSGYSLMYLATHGNDDKIAPEEE